MSKSSLVFSQKLLLLSSLCILLTGTACGQWTQTNGPYGGGVYCLKADGNRLWAGTNSDLFFSDNGGISWQPSDLGAYRKLEVYDLLLSGDTLFCATGSGVFRSFNRGKSWEPASTGLSAYPSVTAIARKGDRLFVGLNTGHIFFSDNYGSAWQKSPDSQPFGVNNAGIRSIVVLGGRVFISRRAPGLPSLSGVLVSLDDGLTWQPADTGLPSGDGFELLVHQGRLYAGSSNKGVFQSWDEGLTWHPYNDGLTNFGVYGIASAGEFLMISTYTGIFKFVNSTWMLIASGLTSGSGALAYFDDKIFVGANGVSVIPDFWGGPWYDSSNGMIATNITELDALPGAGLWASRGGYQTYNQGEHWHKGNLPAGLRTVDRTADYVFATTYELLLRSPDGGNTWEVVDSLRGHYPSRFVADGPLVLGFGIQDSVVFLSNDLGKTWSRPVLFPGKKLDCDAAAVDGENIYLSAFLGSFWVSRDAGQTWDTIPGAPANLRSMLAEGPEILAGSYDGLFASHDAGLTWEEVQVGNGVSVTGLCRAGEVSVLVHLGISRCAFYGRRRVCFC
jgi:photosystem II stability/assembly factor-like uncharacterized protein